LNAKESGPWRERGVRWRGGCLFNDAAFDTTVIGIGSSTLPELLYTALVLIQHFRTGTSLHLQLMIKKYAFSQDSGIFYVIRASHQPLISLLR